MKMEELTNRFFEENGREKFYFIDDAIDFFNENMKCVNLFTIRDCFLVCGTNATTFPVYKKVANDSVIVRKIAEPDEITLLFEALQKLTSNHEYIINERDFKGGYLEKRSNLSQQGRCYVRNGACVFGNAIVSGDSQISGKNTFIFDYSEVCDSSSISSGRGNRRIEISGKSRVGGKVKISCGTHLYSKLPNRTYSEEAIKISGDTILLGEVNILEYGEFDRTIPQFLREAFMTGNNNYLLVSKQTNHMHDTKSSQRFVHRNNFYFLQGIDGTLGCNGSLEVEVPLREYGRDLTLEEKKNSISNLFCFPFGETIQEKIKRLIKEFGIKFGLPGNEEYFEPVYELIFDTNNYGEHDILDEFIVCLNSYKKLENIVRNIAIHIDEVKLSVRERLGDSPLTQRLYDFLTPDFIERYEIFHEVLLIMRDRGLLIKEEERLIRGNSFVSKDTSILCPFGIEIEDKAEIKGKSLILGPSRFTENIEEDNSYTTRMNDDYENIVALNPIGITKVEDLMRSQLPIGAIEFTITGYNIEGSKTQTKLKLFANSLPDELEKLKKENLELKESFMELQKRSVQEIRIAPERIGDNKVMRNSWRMALLSGRERLLGGQGKGETQLGLQ